MGLLKSSQFIIIFKIIYIWVKWVQIGANSTWKECGQNFSSKFFSRIYWFLKLWPKYFISEQCEINKQGLPEQQLTFPLRSLVIAAVPSTSPALPQPFDILTYLYKYNQNRSNFSTDLIVLYMPLYRTI